MYPRPVILSKVEKDLGQQCRFIEIRDVLALYPYDKRLLSLANRLHNYLAIQHDFRKANALIGEVLKAQQAEKLLLHPYFFSAGWFHSVIIYSRWFKSTEGRPTLSEDYFDGDRLLLEKHRYFIDLRDKYVAHYQIEIMGKTELYLTYNLNGELLQVSPLSLETYVSSKADLFDLTKLIEVVHNKINNDKIPQLKKQLLEYIKTLRDFEMVFTVARLKDEVSEPRGSNPYGPD
ncbi:MAG: hypothetical protein LUQ65_06535 [Candidatus Helarchaeota archaeon]|nr:hypothetical protein [Candidatus Helarchaeota archaeon]